MGNILSKKFGINNLEKFLNDVFIKECDLNATQEEVDFIQTGIELLVYQIVELFFDEYIKYKPYEDYYKKHRKRKKPFPNSSIGSHEECVNRFQKYLKKVFFPLKTEKQFLNVKREVSEIVRVGSFYEGTKNNFPDEFDFIFPLFSVKLPKDVFDILFRFPADVDAIATFIEEATSKNKPKLKHKSVTGSINDNMELSFDTYIKDHGPASQLRFIYKNGNGTERFIHVDLVGAYEIIVDHNSNEWTEVWFDNHIEPGTFCKFAKSKDTVFVVDNRISLTGIEVDFMINVLSQKHLRVYRILKYLINGHNDYEAFSRLSIVIAKYFYGDIGEGIPSYLIKKAIIRHHDECTNIDTDDLGPCVLQVLQQLLDFSGDIYSETLRLYSFHVDFTTRMADNLSKPSFSNEIGFLIKQLISLQNTEDRYDYDKLEIKSVTKQFIDHIRELVIDKEKWNNLQSKLPRSLDRYDYDKLENKAVAKQFTDHLRELEIDKEKCDNFLSKLPRSLGSRKISSTRVKLDNTVGHVEHYRLYWDIKGIFVSVILNMLVSVFVLNT